MKPSKFEFFFVGGVFFFLTAFGFWAGFNAGNSRADAAWTQKAIDARVGKWVIDPTTGKSEFVLDKWFDFPPRETP